MRAKYNGALIPLARRLRRDMTEEERRLWYGYLREHPAKFVRQKVLGRYIVDFYCFSAALVIELDGGQHFEPARQAEDARRTAFLRKYGLRVLRIPNNVVRREFSAVCDAIEQAVQQGRQQK